MATPEEGNRRRKKTYNVQERPSAGVKLLWQSGITESNLRIILNAQKETDISRENLSHKP